MSSARASRAREPGARQPGVIEVKLFSCERDIFISASFVHRIRPSSLGGGASTSQPVFAMTISRHDPIAGTCALILILEPRHLTGSIACTSVRQAELSTA